MISNFNIIEVLLKGASQVVKNPPANAEDTRDASSIPGLGRSPGEGKGNRIQYSCLEHPMDKGDWRATVHRVTKKLDMTKCPHTHTHTHYLKVAR